MPAAKDPPGSPTPGLPPTAESTPVPGSPEETNSPVHDPTTPPAEEKPTKTFKPILPDETRPKVRAEDFLPFFQLPGANPDPEDVPVSPTPPTPGTQPPSSATYRQQ